MSGRPWYAHFPADYERKTSHLTFVQDAAYRRLLDHYYATGRPLHANADHLHRVCRAFADAERDAIDYILVEFFMLEDGYYHNKRADEEIAKAEELAQVRRNAANSRYSKSNAKAGHLQTPSPSPSPSPSQIQTQKPEVFVAPKKARPTKLPPDFPKPSNFEAAEKYWLGKGREDLCAQTEEIAEGFRDHHTANGKTSESWDASWRTWYVRAVKFNQRPNGNGRMSAHDKGTQAAIELIAELNARDEARNNHRDGTAILALPQIRHGQTEVAGTVSDLLRRPGGQTFGGDSDGLPALAAKPRE